MAKVTPELQAKREKLETARINLKKKFIGIDNIIDQILDNMLVWYLMPELQMRPTIISLWGTTGVGKTDLVRSLVKELEFNTKFVELQFDMQNEHIKTIQELIENTNIEPHEPCILLLDEMQRFRTLDEEGKMMPNEYFNDIWMLLSDGTFQSDSQTKNQIYSMMIDEMYDREYDKWSQEIDDEERRLKPKKLAKLIKTIPRKN